MKKLPRTQSAIVVSGLAVATFLLLAPSSKAAVVTYSVSAPTIDGADIANLTGSATDAGNVGSGNDVTTYIAHDQPAQGQSFTTGANVGGYTLSSITLQHVAYGTTFWQTGGAASFDLRLGTVVGTTFTQIGTTENFSSGAGFPGDPGFTGGTGAGEYVTFTLAAPITLAANTIYGFDVGISGGNMFFETNGTVDSSAYTDGAAYSTGGSGIGNLTATGSTGDHVFHVDLQAVPEPSTYAMLVGGVGMLTLVRRRKVKA